MIITDFKAFTTNSKSLLKIPNACVVNAPTS